MFAFSVVFIKTGTFSLKFHVEIIRLNVLYKLKIIGNTSNYLLCDYLCYDSVSYSRSVPKFCKKAASSSAGSTLNAPAV